jgi:cytochrome c5
MIAASLPLSIGLQMAHSPLTVPCRGRVPWSQGAISQAGLYCAADLQAFQADPNVSKQDTHFFNVFSMVIGLLIVIAIGIFALARVVASETQDKQVLQESQYLKSVEARLQPVAKEAVAGQDNSALAIKADAGAGQAGSASGPAVPKSGDETFQQVCSACHGAGIAGAPKAGDKAAWGPRISKGKEVLYDHALKGFQGSSGVMPAKGGRVDLPDDLVKAAVDHMVDMAK